jgi:hypothetical protein
MNLLVLIDNMIKNRIVTMKVIKKYRPKGGIPFCLAKQGAFSKKNNKLKRNVLTTKILLPIGQFYGKAGGQSRELLRIPSRFFCIDNNFDLHLPD